MIYETKGLTLEEVDELYGEVKDARKSLGWKPSITFREMTGKAEAFEDKEATEEQREFDKSHETPL
jgi:GDP-D-mannose dehydratase